MSLIYNMSFTSSNLFVHYKPVKDKRKLYNIKFLYLALSAKIHSWQKRKAEKNGRNEQ